MNFVVITTYVEKVAHWITFILPEYVSLESMVGKLHFFMSIPGFKQILTNEVPLVSDPESPCYPLENVGTFSSLYCVTQE